MTADMLAAKTRTDARYLREWLSAQAASGYVEYDADTDSFSLNEEQALALAQEGSPAFIPGAFQIAVAQFRAIPKMVDIFHNGRGLGWHEHDPALFHGTERFFRPGYAAHLVGEWIPSLEGIDARLKAGAMVADGVRARCSTIIMAQAYPASTFRGFDYHEPSIRYAIESARRAGVSNRVTFEVAAAKDYPGSGYDLVTVFDCLHDMGDPVGAARHIRESLKPDGCWMIVEPFANDRLQDNLNPIGRVFYSASTFICTPGSRSQEGQCAWERRPVRPHAWCDGAGRLWQLPPRGADAVQSGVRGEAVALTRRPSPAGGRGANFGCQAVPPTVMFSMRSVGWPTPTGTLWPSLPQTPTPESRRMSLPIIVTSLSDSGPLPISVAPLTGYVILPSSIM
jgi:hypothetical protein